METQGAAAPQVMPFRVTDGLSARTLHVWRSTAQAQFVYMKPNLVKDVVVQDLTFDSSFVPVGNIAGDMTPGLVDTMALEGGYQELARIVHPHPTMSEALQECFHGLLGHMINF